MKTHDLKLLPEFFDQIENDVKTFEVRHDDRGYRPGDRLRLREWSSMLHEYSGREIEVVVDVVHSGFGIAPNFVVLGIRKVS